MVQVLQLCCHKRSLGLGSPEDFCEKALGTAGRLDQHDVCFVQVVLPMNVEAESVTSSDQSPGGSESAGPFIVEP